MVRMSTELESNIVAVERVKEYSETPREVCQSFDVVFVVVEHLQTIRNLILRLSRSLVSRRQENDTVTPKEQMQPKASV